MLKHCEKYEIPTTKKTGIIALEHLDKYKSENQEM